MSEGKPLWGGLLIIWRHHPSGGYGYGIDVPGKCLAVHDNGTMTIEVVKANGDTVKRRVKWKNVRQMEAKP